MPAIRNKLNTHKPDSLSKAGAMLISTLLLFHGSWSVAEERIATITDSGGTSSHYYEPGFNTEDTPNNQVRHTAAIRKTSSHHPDIWINQATIGLNTDHDHDGHFSNFSITLDVDTNLVASAVYAVLYLSLQDDHWLEYAVSNNFIVRGSGPYDAFTIEADLESGYPSGYYNQFIEIYDAHSHEFLLSHGPGDSHALYGLPFESSHHDNRFTLSSDITLSFTGTGSSDFALILPVVLLWGYRRWKK